MDIETVPLAKEFDTLSDNMQKEWERKAKFLKRDLPEDVTAGELFSEKAGVFSEFAKVVCISFGSFSVVGDDWVLRLKSVTNHNEKLLLEDFADIINRFIAYNSALIFCGHNIKEFDLPFLCRRMLINGVRLPDVMNLSGVKPWNNPHIDTLEQWKFGDYKNYTSLSLLAEVLGIPTPKDDIDGSMVASVYYDDDDLPRIAKYCVKDVATAAKVFLKLKGESPEFKSIVVEE